MNAFLSDTIYQAQVARNYHLLAEAEAERRARSAHQASSVHGGAARLLVFALRTRTAVGTGRAAAAD